MNNIKKQFKELYFPFHCHTITSQRDGIMAAEKYVEKCKELGFKYASLTDHGNLGSQYKFWQACLKNEIKPIIGIEFYMIEERFLNATPKSKIISTNLPFSDDKTFHITVIAANEEGYQNILKLNYLSNLKPTDKTIIDGNNGTFSYKPRITDELLFKYQKGLIITSGCRSSIFNQYLQNDLESEAIIVLNKFKNNIDNFFIELHIADNEVEENLFHWLKKFAFESNLPCLIANDAHYLSKGDLEIWNIIGSNRRNLTISNPEAIKNDDYYVKSYDEVYNRVNELISTEINKENENDGEIDDIIFDEKNNQIHEIFNGLNKFHELITFSWDNQKIPKFHIEDDENILEKLLGKMLIKHFGSKSLIPTEYKIRLREEFETAKFTDNCSYYLQVYNLIEWCKLNNIKTPKGRGSAASLLITYLLGITEIDPIKYDLISERASNRERKKMMDIDLDFGSEDAEKVIKYIKQTYGEDCVCNIINYGLNHMSNSIRTVLKYFEVDEFKKNIIAKQIKEKFVEIHQKGEETEELEPTIESIENREDFQKIFINNGIYNFKEILKLAKGIENTVNNFSVHASGILITPKPIYQLIPTIRVKDTICSAFDMEDLENIGALKLDILRVKVYDKMMESVDLYNKHVEILNGNL